jgi:hypothetical protein
MHTVSRIGYNEHAREGELYLEFVDILFTADYFNLMERLYFQTNSIVSIYGAEEQNLGQLSLWTSLHLEMAHKQFWSSTTEISLWNQTHIAVKLKVLQIV